MMDLVEVVDKNLSILTEYFSMFAKASKSEGDPENGNYNTYVLKTRERLIKSLSKATDHKLSEEWLLGEIENFLKDKLIQPRLTLNPDHARDFLLRIITIGKRWTQKYHVIMPLSPCSASFEELRIGPFFIQSVRSLRGWIDQESVLFQMIHENELRHQPSYYQQYYVSVQILGEKIKCREVGKVSILRFFDILQYMSGLMFLWGDAPHVKLSGMTSMQKEEVVVVAEDGKDGCARASNIGSLQPLLFDEQYLRIINDPLHLNLINAVVQDNMNDHKQLVNAVYWLALGFRETDPGCAILYFTYALESLFGASGSNRATQLFSARCAMHMRIRYTDIHQVKKTIRRFYKMRSDLCHGRILNQFVSPEEALWLGRFTTNTVYNRLQQLESFPTKTAYDDYLDSLYKTTPIV